MSSFSKKLDTKQIKAIKWVLEFGFVALFIVFGFFGVFSDVLAYEDDDFTRTAEFLPTGLKWSEFYYDDYDYLTLKLKWALLYEENYPDFPVEAKLYFQAFYNLLDIRPIFFKDIPEDELIWFYEFDCASEFKITKQDLWFENREWCWIEPNTNLLLSVKRLKYNGVEIYNAIGLTKTDIDTQFGVDFLEGKNSRSLNVCWEIIGGRVGYFDSWYQATTEYNPLTFPYYACNIQNCGECVSWYNCQEVGCCWAYSPWLREWYCSGCPTGECGEGSPYEMCQNCFNEENCEAVENCYWFNGLCKFGTGECGTGLECQLCSTQSSCEAHDCYWYDDFCWISEPIEVSSWFDYYAEHGDYATSSAFVNVMASTTETIFRTLSGFLVGFTDIFDVREAIAQGENFGSIIPIARGHLNILNSFFGELPISQAFLFLISFLIAVGTFRLVRNIFNLIKFW